MFDKDWFIKHQRKLVWMLNAPIISFWFRRALRIYSKERITEILPNSYSWGDKLILDNDGKLKFQRSTDFRTHNKYSKRLFYAFKPLWNIFHAWDILVANNFNPAWNLGFDHTFYPDAHVETTSMDAELYYSGAAAAWATVRGDDGTNATADPSEDEERITGIACGSSSDWAMIRRSMFLFDTSALDDNAVISSAVLSFYGTNTTTTASWFITTNIYAATPASNTNAVNADYAIGNFGSTAFATGIAETSWNTSGYNDFTLNASGIAAVDTTGITKFGTLDQTYDRANSAPAYSSGVASAVYARYADYAGTANDPKLVLNYTITISPPAGAIDLSSQVPTVNVTITISAPASTITVTTSIPTITKTGGYDFQDKNTATWTYTSKS